MKHSVWENVDTHPDQLWIELMSGDKEERLHMLYMGFLYSHNKAVLKLQ